MRALWIGLAALAAGLVLLLAGGGGAVVPGLAADSFARLLYLGVLGAVLLAGLLGSGAGRGDLLRPLAFWGLLLLAVVAAYQYRFELRDAAGRIAAGLLPGRPMPIGGGGRVLVERSSGGHFEVVAEVNEVPLNMLIDTGASGIVLSFDDARRVGLDPQALDFTIPVSTANGRALVARARADRLQVGPILRRDLVLHVAEPGRLPQSLLGMSFIDSLSRFEMRGDRLILHE